MKGPGTFKKDQAQTGMKNLSLFDSEPFILQHGLASNAAQWVMFGPERSLGMVTVSVSSRPSRHRHMTLCFFENSLRPGGRRVRRMAGQWEREQIWQETQSPQPRFGSLLEFLVSVAIKLGNNKQLYYVLIILGLRRVPVLNR